MTAVALGVLLAVGVLLCASPRLWPRTEVRSARIDALVERVRERLVQAGLGGVRPVVLLVLCVLGAVAAAAVSTALVPVPGLVVAAGATGLLTPALLVSWRARVRRRAARAEWPDVVEHLVSAVRAGLPLGDALAELAESGPRPIRGPAAVAATRLAASGDLGIALDALKESLADPAADRILETLRMAHEVGGTELPSVLRALGADLRRDAALRAEAESRQAWVRTAARLGIAAPWVVLLLLSTRPEAVVAYGTPLGTAIIVGGGIVSVIAYRVMAAVGRLPEERRWFA